MEPREPYAQCEPGRGQNNPHALAPGSRCKRHLRVTETSFWDLNASSSTLFCSFDYRITLGTVSGIQVALPPNLEVSRVEVRPESVSSGVPRSWVRDWSIGSNRVLKVDFQSPLSGTVKLLLELVPIKALTMRPSLAAPRTLGAAESDAFFAYRLHGLETAGEVERRGVAEMPPDTFVRDVWQKSGFDKAMLPSRAFHRLLGDTFFIRPTFRLTPTARQARQELIWRLEPQGGEVYATSRWLADSKALTFVEWEVPPAVTIDDVRGLQLHSWTRSGNRVTAWLRDAVSEVSLSWHGSLPRSGPPIESTPAIRLDGAATTKTVLRLIPPEGWTLTVERAAGIPIAPLFDRETAVELGRSDYFVRFQLRVSAIRQRFSYHFCSKGRASSLAANDSDRCESSSGSRPRIFVDRARRRGLAGRTRSPLRL